MTSLDQYKATLYANEMSIGMRIKAARTVRQQTQRGLARKLGITPQAVSQWERGETEPDAERLREIAKIIEADFYWLLEGDLRPGPEPKSKYDASEQRVWRAPLVDKVSAGAWTEATGPDTLPADTRYLDVYSRPIGKLFALEIIGESMEPEFASGDIVIIDTGLEPMPGDCVVASNVDEGSTFKKYRLVRGAKGQNTIELVPLNTDYPVLTIDQSTPGRIVGTMVEHRRFRRRR